MKRIPALVYVATCLVSLSLLLVALTLTGGGCADIQAILTPSTQPIAPADRVAQLQTLLNDAEGVINFANAVKPFPAKTWLEIQTYETAAQDAINAAQIAVQNNSITAADALNLAAQEIATFKKSGSQSSS